MSFFSICGGGGRGGVDPAHKVVTCAHTTNQQQASRFCDSLIVSEYKTKDAQGQELSNINLSLFVCFFEAYQPS